MLRGCSFYFNNYLFSCIMKKYIVREDFEEYDGIVILKTGCELWQLYAYLSKKSKVFGYTKIIEHKDFWCVTSGKHLTIVRLTTLPF